VFITNLPAFKCRRYAAAAAVYWYSLWLAACVYFSRLDALHCIVDGTSWSERVAWPRPWRSSIWLHTILWQSHWYGWLSVIVQCGLHWLKLSLTYLQAYQTAFLLLSWRESREYNDGRRLSSNLVQGMILWCPRSDMVLGLKGLMSRSQGHIVQKHIEADQVSGVSLHLWTV